MTAVMFEADCSACYGLCCVALSFERSELFGHDKLAGQPCHHLDASFRCRIHDRREELGYDGCEAFDCLGAGQRASALHADQAWRKDAARSQVLYADFSALMRLQEMRQALETATTLDLDGDLEAQRLSLRDRIATLADGGQVGLTPQAALLLSEANAFMQQLRELVIRQ